MTTTTITPSQPRTYLYDRANQDFILSDNKRIHAYDMQFTDRWIAYHESCEDSTNVNDPLVADGITPDEAVANLLCKIEENEFSI